MPAVGLEPTRVISSTDFESVTSAIPSHRHAAFPAVIYIIPESPQAVKRYFSAQRSLLVIFL